MCVNSENKQTYSNDFFVNTKQSLINYPDPNQEEDWLPETEDIPLAKLKDRHTKSKAKKMGKYRILRFNGFTQSSSLSVLQNERGWHCSSCQYVGKDRNHLKNHILKRHRHEKKLMM